MTRRLVAAITLSALTLAACGGGSGKQPISITLSLRTEPQLTRPVVVEIYNEDGRKINQAEFGAAWTYPPGYQTGDPIPPRSGAPREVPVLVTRAGTYTFKVSEVVVGTPCGTCMTGYEGGSFEIDVDDGDHVVLPLGDQSWVS